MSFYVKSTPEIAAYFGYIYSGRSCVCIVSDNAEDVFVLTESDFNSEKCKRLHSLPEFYFHKELGFLPVPKKMEAKQQNEKADQKEENENMNRKENGNIIAAAQKLVMDLVDGKKSNRDMIYDWDKNRGSDKFENYAYKSKTGSCQEKENFPVVGQRVLIKNDQDYHNSDFGESFIGLEVTVMSKFTIPSKTEGDINMVAVMANEITEFGKNICCCFREDMCHPVKTEQEKNIDSWVELLGECDTIEDVATVLVMNGYHRIKSKD